MAGSETGSMMSCDMSVDSGPESEYNFDEFEQEEKPKVRQRPSSVAQRASLSSIQVPQSNNIVTINQKPPLKVPNFK